MSQNYHENIVRLTLTVRINQDKTVDNAKIKRIIYYKLNLAHAPIFSIVRN